MIETIIFIGLGTLAGSLTGIIPGIHPNTVVFTLLPFYFVVNPEFSVFMAFISGLGVSHTLHDFLPALFLNAPEAESALSSLPGLEMVEKGLGRKAFILTLIGGLTSAFVFILSLPVLFLLLEHVYKAIEPFMGYILLFFLFFIILESNSRLNALIISVLSGVLGMITLNSSFGQQFILMPVFGGLFALPAIFYSLSRDFKIPEQKNSFVISSNRVKGGFTGFLAGLLAGTVPGIGAAVSTSFLTPLMDNSRENFITGLGGVNTSDILIAFVALFLIGKPRTGSSVALQTISNVRLPDIGFLIGCAVLATGLSGIIALKNLELFLKFVTRFDFKYIGMCAVSAVILTTFFTTGLYGLLVLITSSFIGALALLTECRASCMAVLIVPAIFFFTGSFI